MQREEVAPNSAQMLAATLGTYKGRQVVLDTAGHLVYIGTLVEISEHGFWLENADIHDCRDGHAHKEVYIYESKVDGLRTNRRRVFVMRSTVVSISGLDDVVQEDLQQ